MKFRTIFVSVIMSAAVAGTAVAAPLLFNGDFETTDGTIGTANLIALNALNNSGGGSWDVYTSIPGWKSTVPPGRGIEIQRNTVVTAHSGSHYVELESHPANPSISDMLQTFSPLVDSAHTLSFWYQPRTALPGDNVLNAYLDGALLTTVSGPPIPPQGVWTLITVGLGSLLAGTNYVLSFDAIGTNPDNTLGGFIDTISITAVPIPAALPLFGTGLGILGFLGWRRRRKTQAV